MLGLWGLPNRKKKPGHRRRVCCSSAPITRILLICRAIWIPLRDISTHEIAQEAVKKYEELTHIVKPRIEERCVLLQIRPKTVAAPEEGVPPPKDIEPIKIYGDVSFESIIVSMRQLCVESELPPYELTVAMLQSYFETVTGRRICRDGAIINFSEWLPDQLAIEV